MYDLCIELEEHPGNLALIGETLGAAGVNINGLSVTNTKTRDVIHLVVDDPGSATQALRNSGIEVHEVSEVFVLDK
ncbi:MAG: hypothetical protein OQJ84_10440, partial [Xanthomonadales bacterium]|nr:hypothetical protein [Xanthomonadales bacterium]